MEYGLIGEHLGHSYSREIHSIIADYDYKLKELSFDALPEFLKSRQFCGVNVTIPYKQAVIPYLDELSESAKKIGAVNTIVNRNGKLYGYNTDYAGLHAMVTHLGLDFRNKKVLILGTGGTSKTAHAVAESLGASQILHVSRSSSEHTVTYNNACSAHNDAHVIINTTPVGMYPDFASSPIKLDSFFCLNGVIDCIYNPLNTKLVVDAKERGICASGGLYMLSAQAVYASSLFLNTTLGNDSIKNAYNSVLNKKRNIVLIGMPTSGKTTVGKLIAEKTGMRFIDTDEIVSRTINIKVSDFIVNKGESAFRELEKQAVLSLAGVSSSVIATGGGTVMDKENADRLKQNGILVFIDCPLDRLSALPDRPLSSDPEKLENIFYARRPVYAEAADVIVNGNASAEEIAIQILKETIL